jgi:hypothetical protein
VTDNCQIKDELRPMMPQRVMYGLNRHSLTTDGFDVGGVCR